MSATDVPIRLETRPVEDLASYASIPSRFETWQVLDVAGTAPGLTLRERSLQAAFSKDYDKLEDPRQWPLEFDTGNWALIRAHLATRLVGGAIAAFDTPGVDMLEGRRDLVVLWDIRVSPDVQGRGIGASLWRAVQDWGRQRGARELRVETQNVNVGACRFYQAMGCTLVSAQAGAYAALPQEVKLLWSVSIPPER